jgi:hypothetical protein
VTPDFTFRIEATFTDVAVIGMLPEGLRIDAHYDGNVVAGPLAGARVRGIDYLLIRSDGVGVLDVRETITTPAGHRIAIRAQGYGSLRSEPRVGTEAVPLPDAKVTWPDAPRPLLGVATCQTTDPEFLWMNEAMLVFSGTANLGTGKLQAVGRVLTPELVLATPGT